MKLVQCWVEHPSRSLDQVFTYTYDGEIEPGVRVSVPFGTREIIGFVEHVEETDETQVQAEERLGMKLKPVNYVLDTAPLITPELHEMAMWMRKTTLSTAISCFQCMLPGKVKPSSSAAPAAKEKWVRITGEEGSLTVKQLQAYSFIREKGDVLYSEVRKQYAGVIGKLLEKGMVEIYEKEKEADLRFSDITDGEKQLTEDQQKAVDEISGSGDRVFLLKGVTGSGKTEVYLHLAAMALRQGKQVLILVPEISLTPQMIERVSSRFRTGLAIYHSGLSSQEKYEQYRLVLSGKARIVVGTRSSVFLPFTDLGLVVMDEEHDSSYKQENQPAYHCRDAALWRCEYHNCKLVLGSATPSLESYARTIRKVYHLVELPHRINRTLPQITVVNMKQAMEEGQSGILSDALCTRLNQTLKNGRQAILLLNRRGYHSLIKCRSCQSVIKCPHCDISMSWHREDRMLKCHTCGTMMPLPKACPDCHSTAGFSAYGFGTEKLEHELSAQFPDARIMRMDADTTSRKNSHEKILGAFGRKEADILVGTQMIAKGLDYPNVSLVGIINGDEGLNRTDFRSCEVSFDLLMQASGRSGRSDIPGEVVLQVTDPSHYAVQCACAQDYDGFFAREMHFRHAGMYPPYTYLIALTVSAATQEASDRAAMRIRDHLQGSYRTIGILSLLKINDRCRSRILLKGRDLDEMRNDVRKFLDSEEGKSIRDLRIDVNPMVLD